MSVKPVVLVSECLGFEACRYNGDKLRDDFVDKLVPFIETRVVCPEVEIGLGTPREPVRLVIDGGDVRLVQPETGKDVTRAMKRFSRSYLAELEPLDGAVLKGRSPSCGISDAKVYRSVDKGPAAHRGPGLFAAALLERFPDAAIEDEGRLTNFRIREHFLTKLFLRARFRSLKARPSARALVRFHAENKLLLMAYHQTKMRELGRVVAHWKETSLEAAVAEYECQLSAAFARAPRYTSNVNVLMHVLGYFSKGLSSREKAHFLDLLESYRTGKTPLSAVSSVARSWIARFENDYLAHQTFFEPYPDALIEITDSGKGRGQQTRPTPR